MSRFFGYRSHSEIYSNVMLYGPQPVNSAAASGMNRKKKNIRFDVPQRKKSALKQRNSRFEVESGNALLVAVNGTSRVYLVHRGTFSKD